MFFLDDWIEMTFSATYFLEATSVALKTFEKDPSPIWTKLEKHWGVHFYCFIIITPKIVIEFSHGKMPLGFTI